MDLIIISSRWIVLLKTSYTEALIFRGKSVKSFSKLSCPLVWKTQSLSVFDSGCNWPLSRCRWSQHDPTLGKKIFSGHSCFPVVCLCLCVRGQTCHRVAYLWCTSKCVLLLPVLKVCLKRPDLSVVTEKTVYLTVPRFYVFLSFDQFYMGYHLPLMHLCGFVNCEINFSSPFVFFVWWHIPLCAFPAPVLVWSSAVESPNWPRPCPVCAAQCQGRVNTHRLAYGHTLKQSI